MTADDFVDMHRKRLPVKTLCAAIGIKRSTYYARQKHPGSEVTRRNAKLAHEISGIRRGHRKHFGRRRVAVAFRRQGRTVSEKRIGRVMRAEGWFGVPRSLRSRPAMPVPISYQDLVQRRFHADKPDNIWWGDVKQIWTTEGWLYLASLQDAFSRFIVGFAFSTINDSELSKAALAKAVARRRPPGGLIHHTDRGGPYTSWEYQTRLETLGAEPSFSRKKTPLDNACIESFHSTLQRELLAFHRFKTHRHAISVITGWIRNFNYRRYHSTLGYLSPADYERQNVT